jgi:Ca-activated chloride channel family protein
MLVDYLAGLISDEQRRDFEAHLADCAACRAEADELRDTVGLLHQGLAARKGQELRLDPARRAKVLATASAPAPGPKMTMVWWVQWQPVLNVAASVLILATVAIFMIPLGVKDRPEASLSMPAPELSVSFKDSDADGLPAPAEKQVQEDLEINGTATESSKSPLILRGVYASRTAGGRRDQLASADESRSKLVGQEELKRAEEGRANADQVRFEYGRQSETKVTAGWREGDKRDLDAIVNAVDTPQPMTPATRPPVGNTELATLDIGAVGNGKKTYSFAAPVASTPAPGLVGGMVGVAGSGHISDEYKEKEQESARVDYRARESLGRDSRRKLEQSERKSRSDEVVSEVQGKGVGSGALADAEGFEVAINKSPVLEKHALAKSKKSAKPEESKPANELDKKLNLSETSEPTATPEPAKPYSGLTAISAGTLIMPADDKMIDGPAFYEEVRAVEFNSLKAAAQEPFSTFSIDVDTASFTRARKFLLDGTMPPAGAIRVEEFVNAFEYDYPSPERRAFSVYTDRVRSPFRSQYELLRIGVRGKVIGRDRQRPSFLTLVIDASGSMNTPDRLDLIKQSIRLLVGKLGPADRITVVTFGSEPRLVIDHAKAADAKTILAAVEAISATGSTQLEGGLKLGYETAIRHFRSDAINRVILLSDGVANLGAATAEEILAQVATARKQGVYCSVFGFGQGPYNDAMLETLADKGDGVYRFVDSPAEARRVFVDDLAATLHVIAKDVKIQVEFNPDRVKTYRQVGYENRALTKEQFRDDRVDAGEVGSGQSVTALYEISTQGNATAPLGTVRLRWKDPESGQVEEMEQPIRASDRYDSFDKAPVRFRLAAGAAEFADHLRGNPVVMGTDLAEVARVIRSVGLELNLDQRVSDLVRMVSAAGKLSK